jgi:WD40 repeat protein
VLTTSNRYSVAAQSSALVGQYPQRSVLLAVEAVRGGSIGGTPAAAAEKSLREALSFFGGRPVARSDALIHAVAISPDNHWLVTGSRDRTARLWDLTAKDPSANSVILRGYDSTVWKLAISPDNHWLATGSRDRTARLWDLTAKDPSANSVVLRGHDNTLLALAISPENHWLVTGSSDSTARLWDLTAKDPSANPMVLHGHDGLVWAVAISPDNHWLVTGSRDRRRGSGT